jgi:GWxTD domain-containing protein
MIALSGRFKRRLLAVALAWSVIASPPAAAAPGAAKRPEGRRPAASTRQEDFDAATRRWREGPVRYLLTKDEDDAFRRFTNDQERALYIERFWARRDPSPATPDNEYRTLFYKRVAEAAHQFTETTTPGWKTDRGKIYILVGPPDDLEKRSYRDTLPEVIVWTYRNPPPGIGISASSAIRFLRDASGEYRLTDRVGLSGMETPLAIGLQAQAMQLKSLPEPREILDSIVAAPRATDAAAFRVRPEFFPAGHGDTFAMLCVALSGTFLSGRDRDDPPPGPAAPAAAASRETESFAPAESSPGAPVRSLRERLEVVARLTGEDEDLGSHDLIGPTALKPLPAGDGRAPGDFLVFHGGMAVRPGRYTAYFGVVNPATGRIDSFEAALLVPEFRSDVLSLSSIVLAIRIDRRIGSSPPGPPAPEPPAPFHLGGLDFSPRGIDLFRSGEEIAFYYRIYGATIDPIDGHPDLDLEYRFLAAGTAGAGGEERLSLVGQPVHLVRQQNTAQGYSMPLKDWPAGRYTLRVEVKDNLDGRRSSGEVMFQVR